MRDDKIFSLTEYKDHLIRLFGSDYDEDVTNALLSLKIKSNILGVLCKDDKPASKKKHVVKDVISHLNRCLDLF